MLGAVNGLSVSAKHHYTLNMRALAPWCCLLLVLPALITAADQTPELPLVCIVIRTYYGHGTYGDSSLINLLHSLKQQTHPRWAALQQLHNSMSGPRTAWAQDSLFNANTILLGPSSPVTLRHHHVDVCLHVCAGGMRCCWSWTTGPSLTCATS